MKVKDYVHGTLGQDCLVVSGLMICWQMGCVFFEGRRELRDTFFIVYVALMVQHFYVLRRLLPGHIDFYICWSESGRLGLSK